MPELSIIMPLLNTERYVGLAIQSILTQSYTDFELIIVNDASSDSSLEIVQSFKDERIRIFSNVRNQGIVFSRNLGLNAAQGRYIAPFDSDDIAMPCKFRKQLDFLNSHPDFGMIGTWARMIDEEGTVLNRKWKLSASPKHIPAIMLFRNYFVQSSLLIRREAIPEGGYAAGFEIGEDYNMWNQVIRKHKVWNYPEYLVQYRIHNKGVSQQNTERLAEYEGKLLKLIFKPYGISIDDHLAELLLLVKNGDTIKQAETLIEIERFLLQLLERNQKLLLVDQRALIKVVTNRWIKTCYLARRQFPAVQTKLFTSKLSRILIRNLCRIQ